MAGYHLLPSTKEHDHNDDETATPSSIGPAAAKSKLRKYISALASFLLVCIITLVAFVPTNYHVLPNEAAFAEDLSFLSTFPSTEHLPHSSSLIKNPTLQLPPDPSPKPLPSTRSSDKDPRHRATKYGAASSQVYHIAPTPVHATRK